MIEIMIISVMMMVDAMVLYDSDDLDDDERKTFWKTMMHRLMIGRFGYSDYGMMIYLMISRLESDSISPDEHFFFFPLPPKQSWWIKGGRKDLM